MPWLLFAGGSALAGWWLNNKADALLSPVDTPEGAEGQLPYLGTVNPLKVAAWGVGVYAAYRVVKKVTA